MSQCDFCGKLIRAGFKYDEGIACLDCSTQIQRNARESMTQIANLYNYYIDQMEATVGIYGVSPRLKVPEPPSHQSHYHVDKSVTVKDSKNVVANTGEMKDVSISQSDRIKIVQKALDLVSSEVSKDEKADDALKDDIKKSLDYISRQIALSKENQNTNMLRKILNSIPIKLTEVTGAALTLWQTIEPAVKSFVHFPQ